MADYGTRSPGATAIPNMAEVAVNIFSGELLDDELPKGNLSNIKKFVSRNLKVYRLGPVRQLQTSAISKLMIW